MRPLTLQGGEASAWRESLLQQLHFVGQSLVLHALQQAQHLCDMSWMCGLSVGNEKNNWQDLFFSSSLFLTYYGTFLWSVLYHFHALQQWILLTAKNWANDFLATCICWLYIMALAENTGFFLPIFLFFFLIRFCVELQTWFIHPTIQWKPCQLVPQVNGSLRSVGDKEMFWLHTNVM